MLSRCAFFFLLGVLMMEFFFILGVLMEFDITYVPQKAIKGPALAEFDNTYVIDPKEEGKIETAREPEFPREPEFASEMEIYVQSEAVHSYVLLADGNNTVEDVLVEILGSDRAGRAPEPRLYFNDLELEKQKTLAEYRVKLGSVLHLKCTPRVLSHPHEERNFGGILGRYFRLIPHEGGKYALEQCLARFHISRFQTLSDYHPTEIANMGCADSCCSVRSNPPPDGEMKIFLQSEYPGNYVLEVDSSNTIRDVLATILSTRRLQSDPEPQLYFNGQKLEMAKSLADYRIQDCSVLRLECTDLVLIDRVLSIANVWERPNTIPDRRQIRITNQPFTIWEKKHNKVLLGLLVELIQKVGREALDFGKDSWCDMAASFNELTGFKYTKKHLIERFIFYEREYQIVNRIRHHTKFSWDHLRQVVIATDAEWNEYVKKMGNFEAYPYRRRAVPYIDLLEILFAKKNQK